MITASAQAMGLLRLNIDTSAALDTIHPTATRTAWKARMLPFDKVFTAIARDEVGVVYAHDDPRLPDGAYIYREFFCGHCDCRRIELRVYAPGAVHPMAVLGFTLETRRHAPLESPRLLPDPHQPQNALGRKLLGLLEKLIECDPGYVDQLAQHYAEWRRVVEDPAHSQHALLIAALLEPDHGVPAWPRSGMQ